MSRKSRAVRVDALEEEGLSDERVLVLGVCPVVLEAVQTGCEPLVQRVHHRDPHGVERRADEGTPLRVEVGVA